MTDLRNDHREGSYVNVHVHTGGFGPKMQAVGTVERVTEKTIVVEYIRRGQTETRTFRIKNEGIYSTWDYVTKRETH